jgi:hypothetical protein
VKAGSCSISALATENPTSLNSPLLATPEDDWLSARFIVSLCVSVLSSLLSSAYECLLLQFSKIPFPSHLPGGVILAGHMKAPQNMA